MGRTAYTGFTRLTILNGQNVEYRLGVGMPTLRVLLADDHESVRRSLRTLIESHPGWEICAEAVDGRDALKKIKRLQPDLVVLDVGMPYLSGLEVARDVKRNGPQTKILIV